MSFPQNDQTDGGQSDHIAASTIDQCVGPRDRRDQRGWSAPQPLSTNKTLRRTHDHT